MNSWDLPVNGWFDGCADIRGKSAFNEVVQENDSFAMGFGLSGTKSQK